MFEVTMLAMQKGLQQKQLTKQGSLQKPIINRGLKDIYVDETLLSNVNGQEGILTIMGYDISEISVHATYEELAFLLLNNHRASNTELTEFNATLQNLRTLSAFTIESIRKSVEAGLSAFESLQVALPSLFLVTQHKKHIKELIISSIPSIIATFWRLKKNLSIVQPDSTVSVVENFLYMLDGEKVSQDRVKALQTYLCCVMEHGINASTFVSRAISSSDSDLLSAVLGALGSLKGPKHGGAPGPVLEMVLDIAESNDPEGYINNILANKGRLMGFGHRVYKRRDPRADVMKKAGEEFYSTNQQSISELFNRVEQVALAALKKYKPELELHTNVEFYTAYLLHGIGLHHELFSCIFAMARVVGWLAHAEEQGRENILIRPKSYYIGEFDNKWD